MKTYLLQTTLQIPTSEQYKNIHRVVTVIHAKHNKKAPLGGKKRTSIFKYTYPGFF